MEIIRHRVNTTGELSPLATHWGAEIDLRSRGGDIILSHDPFLPGELFSEFARKWAANPSRGTLILNPKEDGIERRILEIVAGTGIEQFFFLDLTIPTLVRLAFKEGMGKSAVRVSEFEPPETALGFAGKVEWVWVDCFSGNPPDADDLLRLKEDFRVCLVSPELQGFPGSAISQFRPLMPHLDAVCTKFPELWQ